MAVGYRLQKLTHLLMVQSGASLSCNGNVWSAKGVPLEAAMAAFGLCLCVTWDLAPNGLMQFAVLRRDSLGLRSLSSLTSILLLWSCSSLLPSFLSFSPHLFCCYQIWPFKLSHYLNQPSSPAHSALPLCLSASLIGIPIFEVPEISQWASRWCCGEKTVYKRSEKDWTNGRGEKKLTPLQCFALLCTGLLRGRQHAQAAHDVEASWELEGIHVCVLWDRSREHRPLILGAGVSCNKSDWFLGEPQDREYISQSRVTEHLPQNKVGRLSKGAAFSVYSDLYSSVAWVALSPPF